MPVSVVSPFFYKLKNLSFSELLFKSQVKKKPEDFYKYLKKINQQMEQITWFSFLEDQTNPEISLKNGRSLSLKMGGIKNEFYSITITVDYEEKITLSFETGHQQGKIENLASSSKALYLFNHLLEELVEKFLQKNQERLLGEKKLEILKAESWNEKIKEEEHAENWLDLTHKMLSEALLLSGQLNSPDKSKRSLSMGLLDDHSLFSYSLFNLQFSYRLKAREIEAKVFNHGPESEQNSPTLHIDFKNRHFEINDKSAATIHLIKKSLKWPMRPTLVQ